LSEAKVVSAQIDLKPALTKAELDIRLVIPYHPAIRKEFPPSHIAATFPVRSFNKEIWTEVYYLERDGLPVYLIAAEPIDQETAVYSSNLEADGFKYVYFSLAVLSLARKLGWRVDILHANDTMTQDALRVLGVAYKVCSTLPDMQDLTMLEEGMVFVGHNQ
jgi:glycogen synthase